MIIAGLASLQDQHQHQHHFAIEVRNDAGSLHEPEVRHEPGPGAFKKANLINGPPDNDTKVLNQRAGSGRRARVAKRMIDPSAAPAGIAGSDKDALVAGQGRRARAGQPHLSGRPSQVARFNAQPPGRSGGRPETMMMMTTETGHGDSRPGTRQADAQELQAGSNKSKYSRTKRGAEEETREGSRAKVNELKLDQLDSGPGNYRDEAPSKSATRTETDSSSSSERRPARLPKRSQAEDGSPDEENAAASFGSDASGCPFRSPRSPSAGAGTRQQNEAPPRPANSMISDEQQQHLASDNRDNSRGYSEQAKLTKGAPNNNNDSLQQSISTQAAGPSLITANQANGSIASQAAGPPPAKTLNMRQINVKTVLVSNGTYVKLDELACRLERDQYYGYRKFRHTTCAICYKLIPPKHRDLRPMVANNTCLRDEFTDLDVSTEDLRYIRQSFREEFHYNQWLDCCFSAAKCCIQNAKYLTNKRNDSGHLIDDLEKGQHYCPATWDGLSCWPDSAAGHMIAGECPDYMFYEDQKSSCQVKSLKQCLPNGTWFTRNTHEWTEYIDCTGVRYYVWRFYFAIIWNLICMMVIIPALLVLKKMPDRRGSRRIRIIKTILFWLLFQCIVSLIDKGGIIGRLFVSQHFLRNNQENPLDPETTRFDLETFNETDPNKMAPNSTQTPFPGQISSRRLARSTSRELVNNQFTLRLQDKTLPNLPSKLPNNDLENVDNKRWPDERHLDLYLPSKDKIVMAIEERLNKANGIYDEYDNYGGGGDNNGAHTDDISIGSKGDQRVGSGLISSDGAASKISDETSVDKNVDLYFGEFIVDLDGLAAAVEVGPNGKQEEPDKSQFKLDHRHLRQSKDNSGPNSIAMQEEARILKLDNDTNPIDKEEQSNERDKYSYATTARRMSRREAQAMEETGPIQTNSTNNNNGSTTSTSTPETAIMPSNLTITIAVMCWILQVTKRIVRQICNGWIFTGAVYLCSLLVFAPAEPPDRMIKWLIIVLNTCPIVLGCIYVILRSIYDPSPLKLILIPYYSMVVGDRARIDQLWSTELDCWILDSQSFIIEEIIHYPNLIFVVLNFALFVFTIIIMCRISKPGSSRPVMSLSNYVKAGGTLVMLYGIHYLLVIYQPNGEPCVIDEIRAYFLIILDGLQGVIVSYVFCFSTPEGKEIIKRWRKAIGFASANATNDQSRQRGFSRSSSTHTTYYKSNGFRKSISGFSGISENSLNGKEVTIELTHKQ